MTSYHPGEVVLVPFPFTDLTTTKRRPTLIVASIVPKKLPALLIVAMITSQLDAEMVQGDLVIKQWKEGGLIYPSKVRLAKIVSIEHDLVVDQLGVLQKNDWKEVQKKFLELFSF